MVRITIFWYFVKWFFTKNWYISPVIWYLSGVITPSQWCYNTTRMVLNTNSCLYNILKLLIFFSLSSISYLNTLLTVFCLCVERCLWWAEAAAVSFPPFRPPAARRPLCSALSSSAVISFDRAVRRTLKTRLALK